MRRRKSESVQSGPASTKAQHASGSSTLSRRSGGLQQRTKPSGKRTSNALFVESYSKKQREDAVCTPSLPTKSRITLKINGRAKQMDVAPWTTLLDALREYLDLT